VTESPKIEVNKGLVDVEETKKHTRVTEKDRGGSKWVQRITKCNKEFWGNPQKKGKCLCPQGNKVLGESPV